MLARLRASTRLAVLVLLIFALKVGAAAACAKNDFAESNFGISGTHGVIVQATDTNAGDLSKTSFPLPARAAIVAATMRRRCRRTRFS